VIFQRLLCAGFILLNAGCVQATCYTDTSVVCKAATSTLEVGVTQVGKPGRQLDQVFGVHSLWWGTQDTLADADGVVKPAAIAALRDAGVTLIRYGGGNNELDWRQCDGAMNTRLAQKVVDWAGPMRCRFGIAEYEQLNQAIDASASWYIANLVGFSGHEGSPGTVASEAGAMAQAVMAISGGRERYWELGNELERGRLKWSASTIADRGLLVAQTIRAVDPQARFVVPLLEYQPAWIPDEDAHNLELIRGFKGIASDFSLHVYYDNAPAGPSVSNRLNVVSTVARQLKQEQVVDPAIWITEHARWPAGNPGQPDWKKTWYQTGNFDAVLSTADFIIGLTQIDLVAGAMWHGLRAGPWNFLVTDAGTVQPGLIARLYGFLKPSNDLSVLQTRTTSTVTPVHSGGYAIRGTAFLRNQTTGSSPAILVWLVNRSSEPAPVNLNLKPLAAAKQVLVARRSLVEGGAFKGTDRASVEVDTHSTTLAANRGRVTISVPPRSVSLIELSAVEI
jgi:hypothetical protein